VPFGGKVVRGMGVRGTDIVPFFSIRTQLSFSYKKLLIFSTEQANDLVMLILLVQLLRIIFKSIFFCNKTSSFFARARVVTSSTSSPFLHLHVLTFVHSSPSARMYVHSYIGTFFLLLSPSARMYVHSTSPHLLHLNVCTYILPLLICSI
jgi:hypothetical protein